MKITKSLLITHFIIIMSLGLQGCMPGASVSAKRGGAFSSTDGSSGEDSGSGDNGGGNGVGPGDGGIGDETEAEIIKVDVKQAFDPFSGTLKSKITIPKDYEGTMYLSGINIKAIKDRNVVARFTFGREKTQVDVNAIINRVSGLTPQTDTDILILDMTGKPFKDIRLLYDLFDYNDYSSGDGLESGELTTSVYDGGLYCRGLLLEDDPTFESNTVSNTKCDAAGEECLYAYAKIQDQTFLTDDGNGNLVSNEPTRPHYNFGGGSYLSEEFSSVSSMCLPDTNQAAAYNAALRTTFSTAGTGEVAFNLASAISWDQNINGSTDYFFTSPYQVIGTSDWQISGDALYESRGVFQGSTYLISGVKQAAGGYGSYIYPRFTKIKFNQNTQYFGFENLSDLLTGTNFYNPAGVVGVSGETNYMYGCNKRIQERSSLTLETASSCNVTATIQIVGKDDSGAYTEVLSEANDLKIQITRDSSFDYNGNEVVYTSLKNCENNSGCGSDECCFNEKCWSKDIVAQCFDDSDANPGQIEVGQPCSSDLSCASFCCNESTMTCADHINEDGLQQVLCNKSIGQACITREFCAPINKTVWYVIKTGPGALDCQLKPFNQRVFPDCDGTCRMPPSVSKPDFDETDPNRCADAVDPPPSDLTL